MNKKKALQIIAAVGVLALTAGAVAWAAGQLKTRDLPEDKPAEGVARVEGAVYVRYLGAPEDDTEYHTIEEYLEGDLPVPAWYDPTEPMAAEWVASCQQVTESNFDNEFASFSKFSASSEQVTDIGCPDWNLDTTLWGWDGRRADVWELDLLGWIFYLEFWGSSDMLCEAGIDAILRLWESGDHGRTLGEVLSAVNERGDFVFSTYPEVWSTEYDADGLARCRAYTEERFIAGPVWIAPYFRLDHYHDTKWSVPAYQIDNVFFSVGKEW